MSTKSAKSTSPKQKGKAPSAAVQALQVKIDELTLSLELAKEENNKLKSELEELKKQLDNVKVVKENNYASELKQAYEQITGERKEWVSKYRVYYDKWYATLSKQEQKKEDERRHNEEAHASEDRIGKIDWVNEYE